MKGCLEQIARRAVLSDRTRSTPDAEYRFWLYDPEGEGMTYYRSREDRDEAARYAIEESKDTDGCWDTELVESIAVGEVTHSAQCLNRQERPPEDEIDQEGYDDEGNYWGDFAWIGNYTLEPLTPKHEGTSP